MCIKNRASIFIIDKSSTTKRGTADESRKQKYSLLTNFVGKFFAVVHFDVHLPLDVEKSQLILFPRTFASSLSTNRYF
jgi:hypothetical protein